MRLAVLIKLFLQKKRVHPPPPPRPAAHQPGLPVPQGLQTHARHDEVLQGAGLQPREHEQAPDQL